MAAPALRIIAIVSSMSSHALKPLDFLRPSGLSRTSAARARSLASRRSAAKSFHALIAFFEPAEKKPASARRLAATSCISWSHEPIALTSCIDDQCLRLRLSGSSARICSAHVKKALPCGVVRSTAFLARSRFAACASSSSSHAFQPRLSGACSTDASAFFISSISSHIACHDSKAIDVCRWMSRLRPARSGASSSSTCAHWLKALRSPPWKPASTCDMRCRRAAASSMRSCQLSKHCESCRLKRRFIAPFIVTQRSLASTHASSARESSR